jgi:hypothetical protein
MHNFSAEENDDAGEGGWRNEIFNLSVLAPVTNAEKNILLLKS